jgi:hypothetical protein
MAESGSGPSNLTLAIVGLLGGIVGASITGAFSYFSHRDDLDAKMIELSVGILRTEPTAGTGPLREWAIDVIDKRAKFPFNDAQRTALLTKQLPYQSIDWFVSDDFAKSMKKLGLTPMVPKAGAPAQ